MLRRERLLARPSCGALLVVVAGFHFGCSAALWEGVGQGMAANSAAPLSTSATKMMIFGGEDHATYLGCLTCSKYASDSVLNKYGQHGSPYQAASIFNPYGEYGSPYSMYSACNPSASDPPVIVDGSGNFYGRLTVNTYHYQATRDGRLQAWIAGVCANR